MRLPGVGFHVGITFMPASVLRSAWCRKIQQLQFEIETECRSIRPTLPTRLASLWRGGALRADCVCPYTSYGFFSSKRLRYGKNGDSSNGLFSEADDGRGNLFFCISILSDHGSTLIRVPSGKAAI